MQSQEEITDQKQNEYRREQLFFVTPHFFPNESVFKPSSHRHLVAPFSLSSVDAPLLPLSFPYSSFITAALPSDIDLGRVATAALQLNMPEVLRKAQMKCGAMDHIDLSSTGLIQGSAAAPSLSGHMCHFEPML